MWLVMHADEVDTSVSLVRRLIAEQHPQWNALPVSAVRSAGTVNALFRVGDDLVARLEGKSSLGRLGLLIHSTAGFVDAGWDGHLTLELSNVANLPITLYPGMKIGQISFLQMTTPADHPYGSGQVGSKYQGQRGPTPSRYFENFAPRPNN